MTTVSPICDDFPALSGRQEPHHLAVFDGDVAHGVKAVELARRAGSVAMPWQRDAQHAILSTGPFGRWTHPDVCLIVPRQNGKGEILIHRCLYGLFKLGETILYTAQRWKTARDAWKRLMAVIKGRAWLRKLVQKATCFGGEGIVELSTGASISFGTRSNDTGRGLTKVDLIVFDEAYNLTDGEISALAFTQMAAENPQTIYASSAVNQDEHPNGFVLAAVRQRGLAREEGLYFAEYMAPCDIECCEICALAGVMDRDDMATAEYANPSFGVIQTAEKIAKIKRGMSTSAGRKGFDVEALGRGDWPEEDAEHEPVVDMDLWGSMAESNPVVSGQIALGVDMTADQDWVTIAAATWTVDRRVRLEVGYHRAPGPGAARKILDLIEKWDPCCVAVNGSSPAKSLLGELVSAGIEPEVTSSTQMAEACAGFYTAAVNSELSHADDPRLTDALAGVAKREMQGGAWTWDYRSPVVISPLQAATLAHWGLATFGAVLRPRQMPQMDESVAAREPSGERDLMTASF